MAPTITKCDLGISRISRIISRSTMISRVDRMLAAEGYYESHRQRLLLDKHNAIRLILCR